MNKKFHLDFGDRDIGFRKGDILYDGEGQLEVISSPFSKWRKFLRWLGINKSKTFKVKRL